LHRAAKGELCSDAIDMAHATDVMRRLFFIRALAAQGIRHRRRSALLVSSWKAIYTGNPARATSGFSITKAA